MRFEYAITIGDPRSVMLQAYQSQSTGSSHLTKTDVMTALGFVQHYEGAGMALVMARYCKDAGSARKALLAIQAECAKVAPRYVGAAKDRGHGMALRRVGELALIHYCRTADTDGAACQCNGRGAVRDMEASRLHGKPMDKPCPRCGGTGLKPVPMTVVSNAIGPLLGDVGRWKLERSWFPLYHAMVAWCHEQESAAQAFYRRITKMSEAAA